MLVQNKSRTLEITIPAVGLLIICALAYGLTAGKLGFFIDDWYIIWTYRTFGAGKFVEFFRGDRPFFSLIYRIFIPLIKDSPTSWQLFAIFTKWLSALSLWVLLRLLLPNKRWFALTASALFAVYTGFKFHYFAVMYAQNYAIFAIYLFSYIFMVLAVRNPKRRLLFTVLGIICQFIGIVPMELYYGLELVRPIILFLLLSEEKETLKAKLFATARFWLPYFLLFFGFTLFRVFFSSKLFSYQISFLDQLVSNPLGSVKRLVMNAASGWYESSIKVWIQLRLALSGLRANSQSALRVLLMAAGFLSAGYIFTKAGRKDDSEPDNKQSLWIAVIGSFAVFAGMIPVLIAGLEINLSFLSNRFLLPLSIGACLSLVALIELLIRNKHAKTIIAALLIALSIGVNYLNGLEFQKAWERQKDFFVQLTWRAPQITPGTVLIAADLPFSLYFSGSSLTAPLNMIYAPDLADNPIPYQMILASSPQMLSMPELKPNREIDRTARVFHFVGNTSDTLTLFVPENGCLKVLDPNTDPKSFRSDRYADLWADIIPLSNLSRIEVEAPIAANLPAQYFGSVSVDTWCYYYQHAALEQQKENWTEIIALYEQAEQKGYRPNRADEWLPLIAAQIKLGQTPTALSISNKLVPSDEFDVQSLCHFWQEHAAQVAQPSQQKLEELTKRWGCGQ